MLLIPSGRESFDHPTGRHNDLGIGWDLSIHGCIKIGLKIDVPGNHVGGQMPEQHSDSFDQIGEIPGVRF
ncbi:MAG: hypothetical protein OER82_11565 [Nitrosopumilus sp.]|nr:hypothetical protein [Nitrosopumilus sp.]